MRARPPRQPNSRRVEASESVRVRNPQNTFDLGVEAVTWWRLVSGVHLEIFRDRVDSLPEHL